MDLDSDYRGNLIPAAAFLLGLGALLTYWGISWLDPVPTVSGAICLMIGVILLAVFFGLI